MSFDLSDKVVFFEGCTMSRRLIGMRFAARFLLDKYGIDWITLPDEECCGSPIMRSGDFALGERLRDKTLRATLRTGRHVIVTACPGCGSTLKCSEAEEMGIRVHHVTEVLQELAKKGILYRPDEMRDFSIVTTSHFPCHMHRGMSIDCGEVDADILGAYPNIEYIRMKDADECCGAGGGVRASQLSLANQIADKKLKNMLDSDADMLFASCPFCELHLHRRQKEKELNIPVIALPTFVALSFYDFGDVLNDLMPEKVEPETPPEAVEVEKAEAKA